MQESFWKIYRFSRYFITRRKSSGVSVSIAAPLSGVSTLQTESPRPFRAPFNPMVPSWARMRGTAEQSISSGCPSLPPQTGFAARTLSSLQACFSSSMVIPEKAGTSTGVKNSPSGAEPVSSARAQSAESPIFTESNIWFVSYPSLCTKDTRLSSHSLRTAAFRSSACLPVTTTVCLTPASENRSRMRRIAGRPPSSIRGLKSPIRELRPAAVIRPS